MHLKNTTEIYIRRIQESPDPSWLITQCISHVFIADSTRRALYSLTHCLFTNDDIIKLSETIKVIHTGQTEFL